MRIRADVGGIVLLVLAATCYSASTIMAKFAYRQGAQVSTMVSLRFAVGALTLWAVVLAARLPAPAVATWPHLNWARRRFLRVLALGVLQATSTFCYLLALNRLEAQVATLLVVLYPTLVLVLGLALGRESLGLAKVIVLAAAISGVGLVAGAPEGRPDELGVSLAGTAALAQAAYILIADKLRSLRPLLLSALILTVAALIFIVVLGVGAINVRDLESGLPLVLVSSAVASFGTPLYLAALPRLGPTRVSIASCSEIVITVALAVVLLGETIRGPQLLGGALIMTAVAALSLISRK